MRQEIIDTNVLLRFFVGDNPSQQKQAEQWLKQAEAGQRSLLVSSLVIAETCFVLESFYKHQREDIANILEIFISQPWLKIPEREILLGLWSWYRQGLHFVDSYLLSWSQVKDGGLLTFDQ